MLHIAFFKFPFDIRYQIVLGAVPVGCDKKAEWRFTEHPFDNDAGIQTFDKIDKQFQIFLIAQDTERLADLLCCKSGAPDDVKMVNFESINAHPRHFICHAQPLIACLPWKSQNDVRADMD